MRLRLFDSDDDDQARAVRARIGRLGIERRVMSAGPDPEPAPSAVVPRQGPVAVGGWVPQVPAAARSMAWSGQERAGEDADAALDDAYEQLFGAARGGAADPPPGSAVVDRLPLPVRALWERWAPRLGRCRVEMGRSQVVVVVMVLVVGLGIAAVVYGMGRPRVVPVAADVVATGTPMEREAGAHGQLTEGTHEESADGPPAESGGAQPDPHPGELVVHVAGKVAEPGVVTLPTGSRVVDAIDAAGGAADGVDLTPLNLARQLVDGEQVLVGVEPPPGSDAAITGGGSGGAAETGLVNLNTATGEQLETLPGIGPALAQRILDWRAANGRFTSIDELNEVSGIGPAKFADIASLVTL